MLNKIVCELSTPNLLPYSSSSLSPAHPASPFPYHPPPSHSSLLPCIQSDSLVTNFWPAFYFPRKRSHSSRGIILRLDRDKRGKQCSRKWETESSPSKSGFRSKRGTEQKRSQLIYVHYCSVSRSCLPLTALRIYWFKWRERGREGSNDHLLRIHCVLDTTVESTRQWILESVVGPGATSGFFSLLLFLLLRNNLSEPLCTEFMWQSKLKKYGLEEWEGRRESH